MAELEKAFVLHRRLYRDTSLLLDLFTEKEGRVQVIARGARRPKSRWRALMHPFVPIQVSWKGNGSLLNLSAAEPDGIAFHLMGTNLAAAFYLNEILVKVLPSHDCYKSVFHNYSYVIEKLDESDESLISGLLRWFEQRLLIELGYGINLKHDVFVDEINPKCWYCFDPERGLVPSDQQEPTNVFFGEHLIAISNEDFSKKSVCHAARRLFQPMIVSLLHHKPIYSRELV